jgi:hypothetical protein
LEKKTRQKSAGILLTGILFPAFLSIAVVHSRILWTVGDGVKDISGSWVRAKLVKVGNLKFSGKGFHHRIQTPDSQERKIERPTSLDFIRSHDAEMDPDGVSS